MSTNDDHNNGPNTALVVSGMGGSLAGVIKQHAALLALRAMMTKGFIHIT